MDRVGSCLKELEKQYKRSGKPIRVSFRTMCSGWPWAKRSEAYTHLMHRYPAKILPYIPIFFLSSESYAAPTDYVLDIFAGTGTVLLESISHPYYKRSAFGVDINPLARLIAKVKTTPLEPMRLNEEAEVLIHRIKSFSGEAELPQFPNRDLWFSPHIQMELARIRKCIGEVEDPDFRDFFLVCFSSIIRDVSLADPGIVPPVILKPEHFSKNPKRMNEVAALVRKKKEANALNYFSPSIRKNIKRIESLSRIEEVASKKVRSEIIWDDARELKRGKLIAQGEIDKSQAKPIDNESIGMVITSPPYINAQKYIRTTKFELFWLGLVKEEQVGELDRRFIGTERVFWNEYNEMTLLGIQSADYAIQKIYERSREKAGIVSRYFADMRQVMKEIYRVLKKGGRFILVVGDNTICGLEVENHKILADIATQDIGFELEIVLMDAIRSRGMITKRHETGGLVLDDWVMVLRKEA